LQSRSAVYRTLWRWHFYAGLFCMPFIIMLSVTGTIYLFKPQIEYWQEASFRGIFSDQPRTSPNEHIAAALAAFPKATFHTYRLPQSDSDAVKISVFSQDERFIVYVNPFDASILATLNYDSQFLQVIRNLHGELLAGNIGSLLVELAACWAIVLIITGLYLWWPRNAHGFGGVVYPRLSLKGRRFWQDMHSVFGIWVSFFALFLLITGLPWALVWGTTFKELRALNERRSSQDWAVNQQQVKSWQAEGVLHYDLNQRVYKTALLQKFSPPTELSVSDADKNIWKLSSLSQNRPLRADAWIESASGKIIKVRKFDDKQKVDRIIGIGIAAHEGQLFGWVNQALGVFTATALLFLSISGIILWRKRHPKRSLGAPPLANNPKMETAVLSVTFISALFLPVLLISLVLMFLLEQLVLKYLPVAGTWLGLEKA